MGRDVLIEIWNQWHESTKKEHKITKEMITQYLNEKTIKTSKYFDFNILFYGFIQLTNIVILSMNLVGYMNNPGMRFTIIGMLLVSICILLYGINIFYKFRVINQYSDSLRNLIDKQLHYYRTHYEIWMVLSSLSVLILSFALNAYIDNNNGYYPIYNKALFIGINIGVFLFLYGIQKFVGHFKFNTLRTYLSDLQKGTLDESIAHEEKKRRYRWLIILITIIMFFIFILGLIKSYAFTLGHLH